MQGFRALQVQGVRASVVVAITEIMMGFRVSVCSKEASSVPAGLSP